MNNDTHDHIPYHIHEYSIILLHNVIIIDHIYILLKLKYIHIYISLSLFLSLSLVLIRLGIHGIHCNMHPGSSRLQETVGFSDGEQFLAFGFGSGAFLLLPVMNDVEGQKKGN